MGFQVSPGVQVKEIDLTNVIPAVSTSIGAFAGHFSWGPVGEAKLVSSEKELSNVYGVPTAAADNYKPFLQAASFLKYTNALEVSRAIPAAARNAGGGPYGTYSEAFDSQIPNIDFFESSVTFSNVGDNGENGEVFYARYPGKLGNSIKVLVANYQVVNFDWTDGSTIPGEFTLSDLNSQISGPAGTTDWATNVVLPTQTDGTVTYDEIHVAVIDEDGLITGVKNSVLEIFEGLSLYSDAVKDGGTNYYKTVINRDSNWVYVNESGLQQFWIGSSLNQTAKPGDQGASADLNFANNINSTRVWDFTLPSADSQRKPGVYSWLTDGVTSGVTTDGNGAGAMFEVTVADAGTEAGGAPNGVGGTTTATLVLIESGYATDGSQDINYQGFNYAIGDTITISDANLGGNGAADLVITITGVGNDNTVAPTNALLDFSLQGGLDGTAAATDVVTALGVFENAEEIDVNLMFAEQFNTDQTIQQEIERICGTARKDCVGFISPDTTADTATEAIADLSFNNSYLVMDSTAVYVYNKYKDEYVYIPASGHIAGLCARTDDTNDPWFSPAGYNRGNLLGVTKLKYNPKKADRDKLYKAGVNPIIAQPGQGILLFGDKTAQSKPSAFDRINVRRLFIVLEKAISTASKYQLFELNDEFTRAMFRNMTEPFLRDVKGRRGITDFLVVCDETNNTGEVVDTNRFVADIYIKPARSINFITLNFIATRTGVEFSEIVGTGN